MLKRCRTDKHKGDFYNFRRLNGQKSVADDDPVFRTVDFVTENQRKYKRRNRKNRHRHAQLYYALGVA